MKSRAALLSLMFAIAARAATWTADNGTFTNPFFYDEFSDPDLIRVGDDYYLTGTTMHAMPGLPVLHSKDLVNWRLLGYASDRLDLGPEFRLENGKEISGQGIWARASDGRLIAVERDGVTLARDGTADTTNFQWIENVYGDLVLLSLSTHRYLRIDPASGAISADQPGPAPDRHDGVCFDWTFVSTAR